MVAAMQNVRSTGGSTVVSYTIQIVAPRDDCSHSGSRGHDGDVGGDQHPAPTEYNGYNVGVDVASDAAVLLSYDSAFRASPRFLMSPPLQSTITCTMTRIRFPTAGATRPSARTADRKLQRRDHVKPNEDIPRRWTRRFDGVSGLRRRRVQRRDRIYSSGRRSDLHDRRPGLLALLPLRETSR
jgi:hypothetical protein